MSIQYQIYLECVRSAATFLLMGLSGAGGNNRNLPEENISFVLCSVHSLEQYIETRCVRVLG